MGTISVPGGTQVSAEREALPAEVETWGGAVTAAVQGLGGAS